MIKMKNPNNTNCWNECGTPSTHTLLGINNRTLIISEKVKKLNLKNCKHL